MNKDNVLDIVLDGGLVQYKDISICDLCRTIKSVIERKYQVYSNKYTFIYDDLETAVDKFLFMVSDAKSKDTSVPKMPNK